jgi:hypothetical protein
VSDLSPLNQAHRFQEHDLKIFADRFTYLDSLQATCSVEDDTNDIVVQYKRLMAEKDTKMFFIEGEFFMTPITLITLLCVSTCLCVFVKADTLQSFSWRHSRWRKPLRHRGGYHDFVPQPRKYL